ncbi:protein of unknown function [Streptantibioticus cattleyicolor NRRL 8057 = DSM 46488]|nr:protein of unknown function [Streptantibioticus cattleyicolor NRRL 8057 = DSM 46488]
MCGAPGAGGDIAARAPGAGTAPGTTASARAGPAPADIPPQAPQRLFRHIHGRAKTASPLIPGRTRSPRCWRRAPHPGHRPWTRPDPARPTIPLAITAARLRDTVEQPVTADPSAPGEPDPTNATDTGHDATRLARGPAGPDCRAGRPHPRQP